MPLVGMLRGRILAREAVGLARMLLDERSRPNRSVHDNIVAFQCRYPLAIIIRCSSPGASAERRCRHKQTTMTSDERALATTAPPLPRDTLRARSCPSLLPIAAGLLRFGVFELDLAARELRKNGARIRLQEQPFQVRRRFWRTPVQVVTREELRVPNLARRYLCRFRSTAQPR